MARSDDAPSSPPEPPGLLRRTTTPTNSPWLYRLLSPFVASSSPTTGGGGSSSSSGKAKAMAKAALGIGSSTNSPSQVDEGYESEDDPARHFGSSCRSATTGSRPSFPAERPHRLTSFS